MNRSFVVLENNASLIVWLIRIPCVRAPGIQSVSIICNFNMFWMELAFNVHYS